MKNAFLLSTAFVALFFSSCNQEQKKSIATNINQDSESNITVRDYLEEAASIKGEAQEIISRAKEINCIEAEQAAENAIETTQIAEMNSNIIRVEHYIEKASQTLADAEEAITYCEDKNEINFSSELKDE